MQPANRIAVSNPIDTDISISPGVKARQIGWLEEPSGRIYREWDKRSREGFGSASPIYALIFPED